MAPCSAAVYIFVALRAPGHLSNHLPLSPFAACMSFEILKGAAYKRVALSSPV